MPSFMMLLHGPANRPRQIASNPEEFTRMTREYMDWACLLYTSPSPRD